MAEIATVARPYAEAVFKLALETDSLARWSERLDLLSRLVSFPEFLAALEHPQVTTEQQVDLVLAACGAGADEATENFVKVLAEHNRFVCLTEIAQWYERRRQLHEGTEQAVVFSAFPLSDVQLQAIAPKLEGHFNTRLKYRVEVDPALIGGIKVAVGDRVLDSSVRGQLDVMAAALNN